jgi:hypothetical protein
MNTLMYSQMGLSAISGWGQFKTASIQADLQERIQAYRNTMSKLSAARSTNAITVNEVRAREAYTENDLLIQRTAMQDQSRAEVQAAAAGVSGNSVDAVMQDLKASAGRASYANTRQYNQQKAEMFEQRQSVALSAIMNQDTQVIPKPSVGSMLLGMGTNLLSIYDSHQPEGSRLLGPNGGRVNDTTRL